MDSMLTSINIRAMVIGFIRMVSAMPSAQEKETDEMVNNFIQIILGGIEK